MPWFGGSVCVCVCNYVRENVVREETGGKPLNTINLGVTSSRERIVGILGECHK